MASAATAAGTALQYSKKYRWNIILMLAASQGIAYLDRVNMSVAAPVLIKTYHYSPATVGILLSMFNWAYFVALLGAGPFVDWVRARVAYPVGVGIWSAGTALCGTTGSFGPLSAFRSLVGIGESAMIPSGQRVISETFPREQHARAIATFFAGNKVGMALGIPFAAFVVATWGLPWMFYVTGILSALWIPWFLFVYRGAGSSPADMKTASTMGWSQLLKYRSTWGLMLGQAGYLYIYYVFLTWLPTYLVVQRHMTILKSGFVGMLPYIVSVFATLIGGWLSDWLAARTSSITIARKTMACGGLFLATVFTLLGAYTPGLWTAVTFMTLAVGSFSLATGSTNTMSIDLAPPKVVSSLAGLQNFGGNLGGALAPMVTGILLASTGNFQLPLLVTAAVALLFGCGAFGLVVGSLENKLGKRAAAAGASA